MPLLNSNLHLPFGLCRNNYMTDYKGELIPLNQVPNINTPLGAFSSGSQMETFSGVQNVILVSSRALETFMVYP